MTTELATTSLPDAPLNALPADPLDMLEVGMVQNHQLVDLPLEHRFTPGLYSRTIFMPTGTLLTSRLHLTEHQYVILAGSVSVWIAGQGWQRLEAGHRGITKAGTRRLLYIHEDCTWMTFHPMGEMGLNFDGLGDDEKVALIEHTIVAPMGPHLDGLLPAEELPWRSQASQ